MERRKKKFKNRKAQGHRSLSPPKSQNFDFSAYPSQNVIKRDASGKKSKMFNALHFQPD